MGHTIPSFTRQFVQESTYFQRFRRSLIRHEDKYLYDRMWLRAETFMPSADFSGHPLPGVTILLMISLAQEISISSLEQQALDLRSEISMLESRLAMLELTEEELRTSVSIRLAKIRDEAFEIRYDGYTP